MKFWITVLTVASLTFCTNVSAKTKLLECVQFSNNGDKPLDVFITLDDSSDKAEVLMYAKDAECVQTQNCPKLVFNKVVLPSVIRLISVDVVGEITQNQLIDLNRTTLKITTRDTMKSPVGDITRSFVGTCKMSIAKSPKKLL